MHVSAKPVHAVPVAVAAVVGRSGILLIRRERPPFVGLWGLPGGKVEQGEHLDEAMLRELEEESGVRARFVEFCGAVTERVHESRGRTAHYVLLVCRLAPLGTWLKQSAEGAVKWFALDELRRCRMVPSDRRILKRLVFGRPKKRYYRCEVRRHGTSYRVVKFA